MVKDLGRAMKNIEMSEEMEERKNTMTIKKREVKGGIEDIIGGLNRFGITIDEGFIRKNGNKIKLLKAKFGNSKIKWKLLNIDYSVDKFYDIPLEGNYYLDREIA